MGKLLPSYKKAILDDVLYSITANVSQYYLFATYPYANNDSVTTPPEVTIDANNAVFQNDWNMVFGKKVSNTDIAPMIKDIRWVSGNTYSIYDSTDANLYSKDYYVVVAPASSGQPYEIFMCLDNASNTASTVKPTLKQSAAFSTADGYKWRYITTVSSSQYTKFAQGKYLPVFSNSTIVSSASSTSGVDRIVIANTGTGYQTYHTGYVQSFTSGNTIQLASNSSAISNFYSNCSLYLYRTGYNVAELLNVYQHVVNSTGRWVKLTTAPNTSNIKLGETQYIVSPRVIFDHDGDTEPKAYSIIDTSTQRLANVVIVDTGSKISRVRSTYLLPTVYGSGASMYSVVPPPGGYGAEPASQLNMTGYCVSVTFSNTESNTIPTNLTYSRVGLLKNPYGLGSLGTKSVNRYSNTTFNQVSEFSLSPSQVFANGTVVTGYTSRAKGVVIDGNSTYIYVVGDKSFINGENIVQGSNAAVINVNRMGDIYAKDVSPLYVQNINHAIRSNTTSETFKIHVSI